MFGGDSWDSVDLAYCILDDSSRFPTCRSCRRCRRPGCERDWLSRLVYETAETRCVTISSGCADYNGGTSCYDGVRSRYVTLAS